MITHGMSDSPEYGIWHAMKQRCYNAKATGYERYGGRGIKVCDRWLNSFESFYEDMGPRPSLDHSLDRRENNGDYEPNNCRWATFVEQNNNQRKNVHYNLDGKAVTLSQASREVGIDRHVLHDRVKRGMSFDEAIQRPAVKKSHESKIYEFNGQIKTLSEWATATGISYKTLYTRLEEKGWTIEKAMTFRK